MLRSARALVFGCFFLSGATGLAYQAVWFRSLQSLFGVTTQAVAVVVAAFMGGLAAGAWIFGGIADRHPRPLRLYGWLELGIAGSALAVVPLLAVAERLYLALHPALAGAPVALAALRLVLALAALAVPTVLMGGTLPALTVLLRRTPPHGETLQRDLGRLYGINTLGAVAGTALVGFVLLLHLGLWRTTVVAALVNAAIGWLCLRAGARMPAAPPPAPGPTASSARLVAPDGPVSPALVRFAIAAFGVSGALSLAYEVAWTRVLAQIIGSSTYAFSLILCAFLLGLALGSLAMGRWSGRARHGFLGFCLAELAIGGAAALVVPALMALPDLQLRAFATVQSLAGVLAVQFALCLLVVLVPAVAMGATFPLVAGFLAEARRDAGRAVGRLYAANTWGGIVGSIAAGFVLVPGLGTQRTLLLLLASNTAIAVAGGLLAWRHGLVPRPGRPRALAIAAAVAGIALAVRGFLAPAWDRYALDAGIAIGGPATAGGDRTLRARDVARGSDMLFYREGLNANISVRKDESQLYLKTNGKTDGTSRGDMPTQLMLGLLPSLVHPSPARTLVIGLGTGASAHAALAPTSVVQLDAVEIEPAVVEAARRYFGAVNAGLFGDPRVRIVVDDARAFLRTSRAHYDIIVSEPSNPWIAGVGNLFSADHYRRCAERMAPGGILAQWLQTYAMQPDLVRMVLASMHAAFPELQIWSFRNGDLIVLASRAPLPAFDPRNAEARLAAWGAGTMLQNTLRVESAAGVLGGLVAGSDAVARLIPGARLNTEDRPRLEFEAPRSLYLSTRDANAALLRSARGGGAPAWPVLAPGERLDVARGALAAGRPEDAAHALAGLAVATSGELAAAIELVRGRILLAANDPQRASAVFEALVVHRPDWSAVLREAARTRFMQGRADAVDVLPAACAPESLGTEADTELALQLVEAAIERGRVEVADAVLGRLAAAAGPTTAAAQSEPPALDAMLRARLLALQARVAYAQRDAAAARAHAEAALAVNAQCTGAWQVLATLAFEAQQWNEAIRWWERLVEYRQAGVDVLVPLARAYSRAGRLEDARRTVRRALARDPRHPAVLRLRDELRA